MAAPGPDAGAGRIAVHGMALDEVAPDWPPLTLAELRPVLARYPEMGGADEVVWHAGRPFAASAIVRGARATVFVKRHGPGVRSVAELADEHAFVAHLRSQGAAVPAVLADAEGARAVTGPGGTYEVHALAEGEDRYRDAHSWTPVRGIADAEALGHALGRLHLAASGFDAPPRQGVHLVSGDALLRAPDLLAGVAAWLEGDALLGDALRTRPWRRDFAEMLLGPHKALQPFVADLPPMWVHGDFHASNLFWRDGGVSAVLDFGLCNRASAAHDLATAIERNTIAWLDPTVERGHPDLARAILRGYDRARCRTPEERAALRHILPVVHVDFALAELAYFHGVTRSAPNAEAAYKDFLLDHTLWFKTKAGQAFLRAI